MAELLYIGISFVHVCEDSNYIFGYQQCIIVRTPVVKHQWLTFALMLLPCCLLRWLFSTLLCPNRATEPPVRQPGGYNALLHWWTRPTSSLWYVCLSHSRALCRWSHMMSTSVASRFVTAAYIYLFQYLRMWFVADVHMYFIYFRCTMYASWSLW